MKHQICFKPARMMAERAAPAEGSSFRHTKGRWRDATDGTRE
jgi:hypothetical protein